MKRTFKSFYTPWICMEKEPGTDSQYLLLQEVASQLETILADHYSLLNEVIRAKKEREKILWEISSHRTHLEKKSIRFKVIRGGKFLDS